MPWRKRDERDEKRDGRGRSAGSQMHQFTPEEAAENGRRGGVKSGETRRRQREERERKERLARLEAEIADLDELPEPSADVAKRVLLTLALEGGNEYVQRLAASSLLTYIDDPKGRATQQDKWVAGEELAEAGYPDIQMVEDGETSDAAAEF